MLDIKIDDRELRRFSKDLKLKRKSQAIAIQRSVLNDEAFAVMKYAKNKEIPRMFINRSTWVASSVLVDKAKGNNTRTMQSEVGAKKKWGKNPGPDFMGLRDQELGNTRTETGIETTSSRSGNSFAGRVKPSLRMDRLGQIISDDDYSGDNRTIIMLRHLERKNYGGAFYIRRSQRFKKGLYKFKGRSRKFRDGKLHKPVVQIMDLSKPRVRLKKRKWLTKSVKQVITHGSVARMYRKRFEQFTKERLKSS